MNSRHVLLGLSLFLTVASTSAQVNDKGTFHASIGIAAGGHATEYQQTFTFLGIPLTERSTDGAATVTYPIQLGYGLAKWFSLGLLFEPGNYLDSNATRANGVVTLALEPRFYLVNKDRFAWMASLQVGDSTLRIDEQGLNKDQAVSRGRSFGLNTGLGFYFSDHIGLQLQARYLATRMPMVEFTSNNTLISLENFDAELKTGGVTLQAPLAFKF